MTPADEAKNLILAAEQLGYVRWKPVLAFYAAVSAIQHALPSIPIQDHRHRTECMHREKALQPIAPQYFALNTWGWDMRYDLNAASPTPTDIADILRKARHILKHCKV